MGKSTSGGSLTGSMKPQQRPAFGAQQVGLGQMQKFNDAVAPTGQMGSQQVGDLQGRGLSLGQMQALNNAMQQARLQQPPQFQSQIQDMVGASGMMQQGLQDGNVTIADIIRRLRGGY